MQSMLRKYPNIMLGVRIEPLTSKIRGECYTTWTSSSSLYMYMYMCVYIYIYVCVCMICIYVYLYIFFLRERKIKSIVKKEKGRNLSWVSYFETLMISSLVKKDKTLAWDGHFITQYTSTLKRTKKQKSSSKLKYHQLQFNYLSELASHGSSYSLWGIRLHFTHLKLIGCHTPVKNNSYKTF